MQCLVTNTQRGTIVVVPQTIPGGVAGSFQFAAVRSGTILADGTLVVANLSPGDVYGCGGGPGAIV